MAQRSRQLKATDLIDEIKAILTEYADNNWIPQKSLIHNLTTPRLLKALNRADVEVCSNYRMQGNVVLYIPPKQDHILLEYQTYYAHKYAEAWSDEYQDIAPEILDSYLFHEYYLSIIEIKSEWLNILSQYQAKPQAWQIETSIRKISFERFVNLRRTLGDHYENPYRAIFGSSSNLPITNDVCTFEPDRQELLLASPFDEGKFLQFQARLIPRMLPLQLIKDWESGKDVPSADYPVLAPAFTEEWLINEAVMRVLPRTATPAREQTAQELMRAKNSVLFNKPSDQTGFTPEPYL